MFPTATHYAEQTDHASNKKGDSGRFGDGCKKNCVIACVRGIIPSISYNFTTIIDAMEIKKIPSRRRGNQIFQIGCHPITVKEGMTSHDLAI